MTRLWGRWSAWRRGEAFVRVAGGYTRRAGEAAAGVTGYGYGSRRPEKRRAELLALRSGFAHWWLREWARYGGDPAEGQEAMWVVVWPADVGAAGGS